MKKLLFVGSTEAIAERSSIISAAKAAGYEVASEVLDPSGLGTSWVGKFLAKRKLRKVTRPCFNEGVVLLVEQQGDSAWESWMVYAAGAGMKMIAVPSRLKGVDNIACVRSGVAVYERLETLADLEDVTRAAMWECQKLAYVAR